MGFTFVNVIEASKILDTTFDTIIDTSLNETLDDIIDDYLDQSIEKRQWIYNSLL